MRKAAMTTLATAILMAGAPLAQAEVSMNIGATSNYVWRGVTQTDNEAAIQGGIDFSHESGFYLGAWASNVNFPSTTATLVRGDGNGDGVITVGETAVVTDTVDDGGYELDLYGGLAGEFKEVGYDIGLIYYTYIDSDSANFAEIYGSLSYKWVSAGLAYTIDGEADNSTDPFTEGDIYYWGNVTVPLPKDFSLGLTVGHYEFDEVDDYNHYQVDLGKSFGDWGDVTLSVSQAEEEAGNPDGDDPLVFISWAKTFE